LSGGLKKSGGLHDPDFLVGPFVEFIDQFVDLFVRDVLEPPGSRPKRWTGTTLLCFMDLHIIFFKY
jgi:hypothetical protein